MSFPPPLRTLIVDDEPIARRILREELESIPGVDVAGEAEDGRQALEQIRRLEPDLVLLDLQMPGLDGFGVIGALTGPAVPSIVVVTAYDQHAIRAFEEGAADYLLKPVGRERLVRCVERVRSRRGPGPAAAEALARLQTAAAHAAAAAPPRRIVGKLGEEYHLLDLADVFAFQADGDTVWISTRKNRFRATQPLKVIQEKLAGSTFGRIHRNALVNLAHVAKMAPLSSKRWLLTLDNQQEFIVSKRQVAEVQKLLNW